MKAIEMFKSETSREFYRELYLQAHNYDLPNLERLQKEEECLRYAIGALEYQLSEYKKHSYSEIVEDEFFPITVKEAIRDIALDIIEKKRYLCNTRAVIAYLSNHS